MCMYSHTYTYIRCASEMSNCSISSVNKVRRIQNPNQIFSIKKLKKKPMSQIFIFKVSLK